MATAKKKTPAKGRATRRNYKAEYEQKQRGRRQAAAIVLFTFGILIAAIAAFRGTNVWLWMHNFLYGLFGITVWVIPAVFIYIAIMATLDKPIGAVKHKLWQSAVLLLLACGLLEICSKTPFMGGGFFDTIAGLFTNGASLKGGGVFSAVIGWPLFVACGKIGSIIIIVLLLFVFVMLLTLSLIHISLWH